MPTKEQERDLADGVVELNRLAVLGAAAAVERSTPADLSRPTPCAGWTLTDLLAHMTSQHRGFAAAARGDGADLANWTVQPAGADPVADYLAAAGDVVDAFGEPGVLDREMTLPELSIGTVFPAAQAISFHLIDYVVHGWDVARTLDLPYTPAESLLAAAARIAAVVPDDNRRLVPGAAFRPAVAAPAGAGTLDRILALLGRSPTWPEVATISPADRAN
jgi:uncharacterized protein (TIGR03086 family)